MQRSHLRLALFFQIGGQRLTAEGPVLLIGMRLGQFDLQSFHGLLQPVAGKQVLRCSCIGKEEGGESKAYSSCRSRDSR